LIRGYPPRIFLKPPTCSRGFTLLEVLVVVMIIGIVISFAVLSLKGSNPDLEDEAQRLQALVTLSSQEAVLQGRELAVEFTAGGYDFLAYDGKRWQPLADDETLRPRALPKDLVLEYQAEGEKMAIGIKDGEVTPPRIYFLSSGEVSPFQLTLRRRDESGSYTLSGDVRGKTKLSGKDDGK
jgi:general secretion pathway protein H